ncbi:MAG: protein kinase [Deltaproteobacteria bacterium]|nr:protein kinase [Deltaproteobacteria bacterium]
MVTDPQRLAEAVARTLADVRDFGSTIRAVRPAAAVQDALAATVAASWDPTAGPRTVDARALPLLATARGAAQDGADLVVARVLGEGGMGVVELAHQRSLQRDVALKRLREDSAPSAHAEALLREATFTGFLEHPNIVPVHALGRDDRDRPLLVMKKIEGTTLATLLHEPSHPGWARAGDDRLGFLLHALRGVCDGLAYAHSRGVLHRDVKPENVMLGRFGEVYLLDWGVATRRNEPLDDSTVGTPVYMAPEMLRPANREIDERTDVYLVGATLHECLAGAPPHAGASIADVLLSIARSSPRAYGDDVPEELADIVRRAMHADRARRFETAEELGRALAEFERHRAAAELAKVAEARLAELEVALATEGADTIEPLFHECRFGFEQSLRAWPENARARSDLRRATARMCAFELAQKNRVGAAALLATLEPKPQELVEGLAALDAELARASEDRARLRRLDHEMDTAVAEPDRRRAIRLAAAGLSLLALVLTAGYVFDFYTPSPGRMLAVSVPGALAVAIIFYRKRDRFFTNRVNRQMALTVAFAAAGVLTNRTLGWLQGRGFADVASGDALLISVVCCTPGRSRSCPCSAPRSSPWRSSCARRGGCARRCSTRTPVAPIDRRGHRHGRRWYLAAVMRRTGTHLALLLVALVVSALLGCASGEPSRSIPSWTLHSGAQIIAVTLPAQLAKHLPNEPSTFALTADAPLDAELRGRELSLVLARNYARVTLVVDGERLAPLEAGPFDRYHAAQMHQVFRIPARLTDRPSLPLRLEIEHHGWYSSLVGRAPLLVASPWGGDAIQRALFFNRLAVLGAVAVLGALAIVFGAVFLLDRARRADGWFALLAAAMTVWHLAIVGVTQFLGPTDLQLVPVVTTTITCVATLGFIREHLGLRDRGRWASWAFVGVGVASIALGPGPFSWRGAASTLLDVLVLVTIVYELWLLGVAFRRGGERRLDAVAIAVAWVVLLGAVTGNVVVRADLQLVPVAWALFVMNQALLLARAHRRELSARIVLLEERNRDVAVLNEELRRQIHDRAGALADALSRLGEGGAGRTIFGVGEKLGGRYQIVRAIGVGGMGAVYEVERLADARRFALKVVAGRRTPSALSRFAREAQVLARFDHPNLVGVVDVDVDPSGTLFVVMELVTGASLERDEPLEERMLRAVARQVATGLRVLHEHGIVHRDLKPANVLLATTGDGATVAKIADFGIARLRTEDEVSGDDETVSAEQSNASLTRTGVVIGTPAYMAPELARGAHDATPASDVFSFGVMLHELATGAHPFKQPPVYAAYVGAPSERVVPMRLVPAWCAALIDRCLAGDPAARPTASEIEASLA